jgi:ABC-2 type transport system permease protein
VTALVRTEWLKLRTLLSNWIIVGLGVASAIAYTVSQAAEFGKKGTSIASAERIEVVAGGAGILTLSILAVGVLAMTTEFRYGTITQTLVTAPVRGEVLTAKVLTLGIASLGAGLVGVLASGAIAQRILDSRDYGQALVNYEVFRPVLGGVLFLGICAVVGVAVGAILRQQPLAIAVVLAWPLVVESTLGAILPGYISQYLPFNAGQRLFATSPADSGNLDFWVGGAVFATWAAVLLVAAFALFARRDVSASS